MTGDQAPVQKGHHFLMARDRLTETIPVAEAAPAAVATASAL